MIKEIEKTLRQYDAFKGVCYCTFEADHIKALMEFLYAAEAVGYNWSQADPDPERRLNAARAALGLK